MVVVIAVQTLITTVRQMMRQKRRRGRVNQKGRSMHIEHAYSGATHLVNALTLKALQLY